MLSKTHKKTNKAFHRKIRQADLGRSVLNPTRLTNSIALFRDSDAKYQAALAQFCLNESAIKEVIAKRSSREVDENDCLTDVNTRAISKPMTYINEYDGSFHYHHADIIISHLMRDDTAMKNYYLKFLDMGDNHFPDEISSLKEMSTRQNGPQQFDTSFSFVPEGPLKFYKNKARYCKVSQFDTLSDSQVPLRVYGNEPCPVFGYLIDKDTLESVKNKYSNHPFYKLYTEHVIYGLHHLSKPAKAAHWKRSMMTSRILGTPSVSTPFNNRPVTHYTGTHEVTVHDRIYNMRIDIGDKAWIEMSNEMLKPILDRPGETFAHQKVSYLMLNISITTYTARENPSFTGDTMERIKKMTKPSTILAQHITVRGTYFGNAPCEYMFQPQCSLVFSTTNRGYHATMSRDENVKEKNPALITHHFGYGLPAQMEVGGSFNFCGNNFPSLPTELAFSSVIDGVPKIISKLSKFEAKENADLGISEHLKDCVLKTIKKTFEVYNKKTSDEVAMVQHYHTSQCTREHGFLVSGQEYADQCMARRVRCIHLVMPQGDLYLSDGFAPDWDWPLDTEKYYQDKAVKQYVSGMSTPSNVFRDLSRGDRAMKNMSRFEDAQRVVATEQLHFEDLSIADVLAAASLPSVFDEEVYM